MLNKKLQYTRTQIKNAGKTLIDDNATLASKLQAVDIVDNWRAVHAYPLQIVANGLRNKLKSKGYVIVQRLKRLDSIIGKVNRKPHISLCHMQDLAGCRVIVPSIDEVYTAFQIYEGSTKKLILHRVDDYIDSPKTSGYRGVHAVYRYWNENNPECHRMFVEIQFRTQLQHLWSTAVETMGIYTATNLKAGIGPESVLRFFALVSSVFAKQEKQKTVPNTPASVQELMNELKELCHREKMLEALRAIRTATQEIVRRGNNAKYYILILNFYTCTLRIKEYAVNEFDEARKTYDAIESQNKDDKINAVLVSASSISELKYAYPNYFTDIGSFVRRIEYLLLTDGAEIEA